MSVEMLRWPMAKFNKTAIALQGGGALGAYAFGALKAIYASEPGFRPSCVSGVSIGAFTAAIVASHPDDPIPALQSFWDELTIPHSPFIPEFFEPYLSYFGNRAMYSPRLDYFSLPFWTYLYDLSPVRETLNHYVDLDRIEKGDVKLVITATNIESGEIDEFSNDSSQPITLDHIIASGSLPPSYSKKEIYSRNEVGKQSYWDGGLFDNTPLGALLGKIDATDAATTRIIVVNLFPKTGNVPMNMLDVFHRMIDLNFSNKTKKDIELARKINKLVLAIEQLQGVLASDERSVFQQPGFQDLRKYRVFENIIPITNAHLEQVSSSADFSKATIDERIKTGFNDAKAALATPAEAITELRKVIAKAA
jgi:NTE family protein